MSAPDKTGRMDIESAPRDGTPILAHCQPRFWETGKPMSFSYVGVVWWRGEKFKDSLWPWRHSQNDSAAEPTHWMSLPLPPEAILALARTEDSA